ncbi:hypothetical protein VTJ04DRAFT_8401 [Mycothermus thermophilus]|uniref:uncharacterized protein n=1 Tax=Humicola insolens TaxID=85995 RepID=UPI00374396BD
MDGRHEGLREFTSAERDPPAKTPATGPTAGAEPGQDVGAGQWGKLGRGRLCCNCGGPVSDSPLLAALLPTGKNVKSAERTTGDWQRHADSRCRGG